MLKVTNAKQDLPEKIFKLKEGCNLVGSNLICDIRINHKQVDKVHLIIKLQDDRVMLMDNQSEKGTFKLDGNQRQNLTSLTLYDYDASDPLAFSIGDFKIEYYQDHNAGIKEQNQEDSSEEENDQKLNHNPFLNDATQIIPNNNGKPKPKVEKKAEQLPAIFDMNDATQILGEKNFSFGEDKDNLFKMPAVIKKPPPVQQKNNNFLLPAPLRGNMIQKQKVAFAELNDATQIINDFGGNNKKAELQNEKEMLDQTQILNFGDDKKKNEDFLNDATQIIPNFKFNTNSKAKDSKPKVPAFDMNDATQIIGDFQQPKKQNGGGNFVDPTLIIPSKKENNQKKSIGLFEPTLLLNDPQSKVHQEKQGKSEIDRLINSDDDEVEESPNFGKIKQKNKKRVITDSVEDIMDALDMDDKKKDSLDKVIEEVSDEEDDNNNKGKQVPNQKFSQKVIEKHNSQQDKQERNSDHNDSIDEFLDEDQDKARVQGARYNKKRKFDQINNEVKDEPESQQSVKKRKQNEEEKKIQEVDQKNGKKNQKAQKDKAVKDEIILKKDNHKKVVLIGGKAKDEANKKMIAKLGGVAIEEPDGRFDVYVTDGKLVRNCKLLQAISCGAAVLNSNWLKDSQKQNHFIEQLDKYYIIDKDFQKQHGCNLKQLYESKNADQLLNDQKVFISNSIGISKDSMANLIKASGGEVVEEKHINQSDFCILDPEKDKKRIEKLAKQKNAPKLVTMHLIFDGILQQKLDFENHSIKV